MNKYQLDYKNIAKNTLGMIALLYGSFTGMQSLDAGEYAKKDNSTKIEIKAGPKEKGSDDNKDESLEKKVKESSCPFKYEWIQSGSEKIKESRTKKILDDYLEKKDDATLMILSGYGKKSKRYIELPIVARKTDEDNDDRYQLSFMFCGKDVEVMNISDLFDEKAVKRRAKEYDKIISYKQINSMINLLGRTMSNLKIFSVYDNRSGAASLKKEIYEAYKKIYPNSDLKRLYAKPVKDKENLKTSKNKDQQDKKQDNSKISKIDKT